MFLKKSKKLRFDFGFPNVSKKKEFKGERNNFGFTNKEGK